MDFNQIRIVIGSVIFLNLTDSMLSKFKAVINQNGMENLVFMIQASTNFIQKESIG